LGKAVDNVAGSTDTGVAPLVIRDDALTTLTPVDGDYVNQRANARGASWVAIEDGAGGQITSFGGGTEYTEDAAAAADPVGKAAILVRKDTPATITSTDGDNVAQRGTNYGAAYVQVVSSTGSYVDTFGGGTQYTEDVASAADPVGNMGMAVRADSLAAVTSTDGDNIALRATNKGELYVKQSDSVAITAASLPLPSGAATSAAQTDKSQFTKITDGTDTALVTAAGEQNVIATAQPGVDIGDVTINNAAGGSAVNVQDGGNSLTVDNAGTFAVQASIASGASTIGKAEDSASANLDVGVPSMAVRKATPANTSDTDGDYEMLQMSAGRLWTSTTVDAALPSGTNNIGDVDVLTVPADPFGANADAASATGSISAKLRFIASTGIPVTGTVTVGSHAVTNAGTFAVQDSEKITDNAGFTDGTTKVQPAGFIFDEAAGTALTENDAAAARIDSKRAQIGVIEDATTREGCRRCWWRSLRKGKESSNTVTIFCVCHEWQHFDTCIERQ
jgi:hypothetical protein